jgi:methylated-DNA-[protein]-cysteine S-methyltransferase
MNFNEKCYSVLRKVPRGKVTTYLEIAKAIESPNAARAVGNAMNKNPYAPIVPCHRVVCSDGKVGGFASGTKKKIEMLKKEGVEIINGNVDLGRYLWKLGRYSDYTQKKLKSRSRFTC